MRQSHFMRKGMRLLGPWRGQLSLGDGVQDKITLGARVRGIVTLGARVRDQVTLGARVRGKVTFWRQGMRQSYFRR